MRRERGENGERTGGRGGVRWSKKKVGGARGGAPGRAGGASSPSRWEAASFVWAIATSQLPGPATDGLSPCCQPGKWEEAQMHTPKKNDDRDRRGERERRPPPGRATAGKERRGNETSIGRTKRRAQQRRNLKRRGTTQNKNRGKLNRRRRANRGEMNRRIQTKSET